MSISLMRPPQIEGVLVVALYADLTVAGWALTDTGGHYVVSNLPAGDYKVWAKADGYAAEFYNDVHYYPNAELVTVTPPDETVDINFALVPGSTISGHVFEPNGTTPIEGAKILVVITLPAR